MNDIVLGIIVTTIVILLLVTGVVYSFFRIQQQRAKQKEELAATKLAFERELRAIETEEREKILHQLAYELHDNAGQLLVAMHMQIQTQKMLHPDLAEGYKPIEIYLGEVTQQLRLLSKTLNSDAILQNGFEGAIRLEIERLLALKTFTVTSEILVSELTLDKDAQLMIFRIFQEIIQNVLKHSHASSIEIRLKATNSIFELSVSDNGKGFDYENLFERNKASGVKNILNRAKLAGLECVYQTKPNEGTTVILKNSSN